MSESITCPLPTERLRAWETAGTRAWEVGGTYDSYTLPDSVAPSTNVTPVPLSYHAGWLPRFKKAVPVSGRVLRSQVANKFVAKHKFRGLTVTPLNGLDFD